MARPTRFTEESLESFRQEVIANKLTPKEIAQMFGLALPTVYGMLSRHNIPVFKSKARTKFHDPNWRLVPASAPCGMSLPEWGPWVSTESIPRDGTHYTVFRLYTVPIAALLVAEHITRKIPDLSIKSIRFKDGNPQNVTLDNIEYLPALAEEEERQQRKKIMEEVRTKIQGEQYGA